MATARNIPPAGVLKLYRNVDIGQGRQRVFQNRSQQQAYFASRIVKQFDGLSYMRMGDKIKVEIPIEQMSEVNFLSYTNRMGGTEKEIYAYINPNWEYVNNNTVEFSFEIAAFQTIMFDMTVKEGLISREHLSQSEWDAAVSNPFMDIMQLQTDEPLPSSASMERLLISKEDLKNYHIVPNASWSNEHPEFQNDLMLVLAQTSFEDIKEWDAIVSEVKELGGEVVTNDMIQGVPSIATIITMPYAGDVAVIDRYRALWKRIFTVIESAGLTGNIMGLYFVPLFYKTDLNFHSASIPESAAALSKFIKTKPSGYSPRNPKLYRAPYSFMRVRTMDGQEKIYEYENFVLASTGDSDDVLFVVLPFRNGTPTVGIVPYAYKRSEDKTELVSWSKYLNFDEMMVYSEIPHLPYATDGYVSYMSSEARRVLQTQNKQQAFFTSADRVLQATEGKLSLLNSATTMINPVKGIQAYKDAGGIIPLSQSMAGNIRSGISGLGAMANRGGTMGAYNTANAIVDNPSGLLGGNRDAISFRLGLGEGLEKATAADNVYSGATGGWIQYLKEPLRFYITQVTLRDSIVEIYDRWLDYYGYASSRIGVPHIVSYIKGGADQPHFATIDGEQVTYAKATVSVYTNGKAPQMLADEVKAMFEAGTLFVKG